MIFHINRLTFKSGLSEEQRRTGLGLLRQAGEANPAVQSYVVLATLWIRVGSCAARTTPS
jgi:hypothetical protein